MMKQLLIEGFFHGDPHPGNLFIDPEDGRITFLDLGLVGELRTRSADGPDRDGALAPAAGRRRARPGNPAPVYADSPAGPCARSAPWWTVCSTRNGSTASTGRSERCWISSSPGLAHFGLRMDAQLTLAVKSMAQSEEAALALAPGAPLLDIVADETKLLLLEHWTPERIVETLKAQGMRSGYGGGAASSEPAGSDREMAGPVRTGQAGGRGRQRRPVPSAGSALEAHSQTACDA